MFGTELTTNEILILIIGFVGQSLFFMRFFVQWLYSEKHKRSLIPTAFWYFSLGGSSLLLIYAIIRRDPVFMVGQSTGFIIYIRNLFLISRERREKRAAEQAETPLDQK
ncbi:lipid-A-disaccharide synthase N-terminal domain-containing protein [Geopsychrobacter electrodiphilus]|uniref:lipid-A-disaccharide synthase N-terminal domain-containing protein n=1 Tax=Geopsychrobacter electrodiphilus TaxID=225196 RepID=UPI0003651532|nr:lipid-A-disaccharide synthase N-terminal domain-containing protein [Geopsychrobacter electrodiphilus]